MPNRAGVSGERRGVCRPDLPKHEDLKGDHTKSPSLIKYRVESYEGFSPCLFRRESVELISSGPFINNF